MSSPIKQTDLDNLFPSTKPENQWDQFEYFQIFRQVDMEKARSLHNLCLGLRNAFSSNPEVPSFLLRRGIQSADINSIYDSTFVRTSAILMLNYLNHIISLSTRPQIISFASPEKPLIIHPFEEEKEEDPEVKLGGFDYAKIEALQRSWLKNPIVEQIRAYGSQLEKIADIFNLKYVLDRIQCEATYKPSFEVGESPLGKKVIPYFEMRDEMSALDSAYYSRGKQEFRAAKPLWEKLNEDEFGRFFILMPEELQEGVQAIYSQFECPEEEE